MPALDTAIPDTKIRRARPGLQSLPAETPAEQVAQPAEPEALPAVDLAAENASLRAQLTALVEQQRLAAVMKGVSLPASVSTGKLGKFKVKLPGLNPRVVDAEGRAHYPESMVVEALTEADAFFVFTKLNGISSTTQTPSIERLPD